MKSNAKKYDDFTHVVRIIESCENILQTLMAVRIFKQFCRMHPSYRGDDYECRELRCAIERKQKSLFNSEVDFLNWASTQPFWARYVPPGATS